MGTVAQDPGAAPHPARVTTGDPGPRPVGAGQPRKPRLTCLNASSRGPLYSVTGSFPQDEFLVAQSLVARMTSDALITAVTLLPSVRPS